MEHIKIQGVPAVIYGDPSDQLFLFIHGRNGYKEEAESFANIVCQKGYQVLSFDLPEHGERKGEAGTFNPWNAVPEFKRILCEAKNRWQQISLRANSIGAYFSLLSFAEEPMEQCLFVSPILDMEQLIINMMTWSGVTEEQLKQQKLIPTKFGESLSWEYLQYVRENRIETWKTPTSILYGSRDQLTERAVVDAFVQKYSCDLTVMPGGEHWFHTPEQLERLDQWTKDATFDSAAQRNKN